MGCHLLMKTKTLTRKWNSKHYKEKGWKKERKKNVFPTVCSSKTLYHKILYRVLLSSVHHTDRVSSYETAGGQIQTLWLKKKKTFSIGLSNDMTYIIIKLCLFWWGWSASLTCTDGLENPFGCRIRINRLKLLEKMVLTDLWEANESDGNKMISKG